MKLSRKLRLQLQLQKIIFITLLLVAVVLLGTLANKHSVQFDWTSNKRNTLSQSSIELLHTLEHPVLVTVYVQDDETVHAAVEEILQRYQREKEDFNFRLVNPDIDFETAQQDNVDRYGQIIIKYNDNKESIAQNMLKTMGRPDREAIEKHPEVMDDILEASQETFRSGTEGAAWSNALMARPWGFPLEEIQVPVGIYYGQEDTNVPLAMAEHLAQKIPGSQLHIMPNEGHGSILINRMEEILNYLAAPIENGLPIETA